MTLHPSIDQDLKEFALVFRRAGKSCYIVGGAIRDMLMCRSVNDYDVATDARPEEVKRLFKRVIPTGIEHGTVTVLWRGRSIETTTFRRDVGCSDGRHPDSVEFGVSLEEDLARRDFTINAMALDPLDGSIVDPHNGKEDLDHKLIRAVGDPAVRFKEDGLRPLRALRFASQLGFEVEEGTLESIPDALDRYKLVSAERIRVELEKILLSPQPSRGLRLLEQTGILAISIPELARCRGVEQKGLHRFDVLDHLFASVEAASPDLILRLSALFHDSGKPDCRVELANGSATFHGHESVSANIAQIVLRRFRFPNSVIAEVSHLIKQHMFFYDESWSDAAVRRFIARVGVDHLKRLFALRLADGVAIINAPIDPRSLEPLQSRIESVLAAKEALGLKDLQIGGLELSEIGIPQGPPMGLILAELLETVLDDPEQNTRERLLRIAHGLKGKYGISG